MSKQKLPLNQKSCTNSLGRYPRAMETESFVFFVNFEEGDENGQVIMYRKDEKNLELISDNYFASVGLQEALQGGDETWMSPRMKKKDNCKLMKSFFRLLKNMLN